MENLIGIIVYVILMALNITIIECMFWYNEFLVIASIFSVLCLMPGSGKIKERGNRYEWADLLDKRNPLFVQGYFRKNASKKTIRSKLKGNYYCEYVLLLLYVISALYRLYCVHILYPQGRLSVLKKSCAAKKYHFCGSIFIQEENIHTSF